MPITLRWHNYIMSRSLPDADIADIRAEIHEQNAGRGWRRLIDRYYDHRLIVNLYDDDPYQTLFALKYADYIDECTAHDKTYELPGDQSPGQSLVSGHTTATPRPSAQHGVDQQ